MASYRTKAWNLLTTDEQPPDSTVFVGKWRTEDYETYRPISELEHFWSDLNRLWSAAVLDDELVRALFEQPWCKTWGPVMNQIDHRVDEEDTSAGAERFNDFLEEEVRSIGDLFGCEAEA